VDIDVTTRVEQLRDLAAGLRTRPWLDTTQRKTLKARLKQLPVDEQIDLLRFCVAEMPHFRGADNYSDGSLLYDVATLLYSMGLPLSEDDLCELLRTASHTCGHGCDVQPPFELARDYMRSYGFSVTLLEAIHGYRNSLPPARSVQLKNLLRSVDLLGVLDPPQPPGRGVQPWTVRISEQLLGMAEEERQAWQQLVLSMAVREPHTMPATWARVARAFVEELGTDTVVGRLQEFWPEAGEEVSLKRGGAQLLKHFVWLLSLLPDRPEVHELAARLATMTWHRQDPPMGVLKPAAEHLADRESADLLESRADLLLQIAAAGG